MRKMHPDAVSTTNTRPPWASTSALTIGRPRPLPPLDRSRLASSTAAAGGSWVDGFRQAGDRHDATLLHHVQDAFTSGFRAVGIFGVLVMIAVLVILLRRGRAAAAAPADTGEPAAETVVAGA